MFTDEDCLYGAPSRDVHGGRLFVCGPQIDAHGEKTISIGCPAEMLMVENYLNGDLNRDVHGGKLFI